ncbi:hypothetical protein BC830DRAFT_1148831 [Chytriomyces sp. MP71]|nr:hypothetical protein BC830DRAFT_1148831 [Chytriomyces sp. MP71]
MLPLHPTEGKASAMAIRGLWLRQPQYTLGRRASVRPTFRLAAPQLQPLQPSVPSWAKARYLSTVVTKVASTNARTFKPASNPAEAEKRRNTSVGRAILLGTLLLGLTAFPTTLCILAPSDSSNQLPWIVAVAEAPALALGVRTFGFVLPFLPPVIVGAFLPFGILLVSLNDLRRASAFDHTVWELASNDTYGYNVSWSPDKVRWTNGSVDHGIVGSQDVAFLAGIGRVVDRELEEQRDFTDVIIVLRGRNVGPFGPLMRFIEIPFDRRWIRECTGK